MNNRRYPGTWAGNVCNAPELATTATGTARLTFRLAEDRGQRNEAGVWEQTGTNYYFVVVWGHHATRLAELLRKGDAVDIRGDLEVTHTLDEQGHQKTDVRIIAGKVLPDWTRMAVHIDRTPRNAPAPAATPEVAVDPKAPTPPPMKQWPMAAHPDAAAGMAL